MTNYIETGTKGRGDIEVQWHAVSQEEVLRTLEIPSPAGLTSAEVKKRLERYGPNQLAEKPRQTFLKLVFDQLNNFIVILLLAAAGISVVMGEWVEAVAIMAIVILNAILGVIQESRAEEALAALKKLAAPDGGVGLEVVETIAGARIPKPHAPV